VEKKQYEICNEVLKRFHKMGILNDFILIGSWCIYFYKDYFSGIPYINQATIRTRDIDFLITTPAKIEQKVNIPGLLKDLGFVTSFKGRKGYIKLDHPDLIIEFLVPERGRGIDNPYPLPNLGMNATTLRFLTFLSDNTIKVKVKDFNLTLPHPVNFALHKLIIFQRRLKQEKAIKDRNAAIQILEALIAKGEEKSLRQVFDNIPKKWQRKIIHGLDNNNDKDLLQVLG